MSIYVEGDKALIKALEEVGKKQARKAVRKSLRTCAKIVKNTAKAAVPVDTGFVRRKIRVRAAKRKGKGAIKRGQLAISVNTHPDAYWGTILEKSKEQVRKTKDDESRGVLPRNTWLTDSLHRNRLRLFLVFRRDLWKQVQQIKAKGS